MQQSIRVNGHPETPGPSPQEDVRQMDPEMEAVGQEEETQVIQPAMHIPLVEVQVPIVPQEEDSRTGRRSTQ